MKTKTNLSNEELTEIISKLNFGSNEFAEAMYVSQQKDRYLWEKINNINYEVEKIVNDLRILRDTE